MNSPDKGQLLRQIAAITTMERGKLSTYSPNDADAAVPYHKLQRWENGKNHTRHVSDEEVPAVQTALAGHARYQQLTAEYAELVITETRQQLADAKKKTLSPPLLLAQEEEVAQLIGRYQSLAPHGAAVAELEVLVRTAVFNSANALVGWLLQQTVERIDAAYQPKAGAVYKGREAITVQGIFGHFELQRAYYYDAGKEAGHHPADAALGLEGSYTPTLAKLICLEGADEQTYLKAERHLEQTGGIAVSARQIQRVVQRVGGAAQQWQIRPAQPGSCAHDQAPVLYISADGTGVPMVSEELAGRKGKQADGKAKTRQAYLGCVFTQHRLDDEGRPVRDWESTTYISSFKSIDQFGPMLRHEAFRRGFGTAGQAVVLIDGANGLANMARLTFPACTQIVDFYHAMEHAGAVLEALLGKAHAEYKSRLHRWAERLLRDEVEALIAETREECAGRSCAPAVEEALHYFTSNVSRMQYGTFRAAGYFIGSGVVEAGCKTVIGGRCKQSGMFWSEAGAENILALRCIHSSHRLDRFWQHRLDALAARNDCLPFAPAA